jgi:diguanylate cyclase (GGDEF)-like protein
MTSDPPSTAKPSARQPGLPTPDRTADSALAPRGRAGLHDALLITGSLLLAGLIGLLDLRIGPHLSVSVFYFLPVAACAWWGGFPHGILLALASAFTWHLVDGVENPAMPPVAGMWNAVVRFGTLTLAASLVARLHAGILRERRLASTDPLTGSANARTFYEAASIEAERAVRAGRPLTLAYLDLDDFKQLNDRLGHAAGDEALRELVRTVHVNLRGADLLARLGGDEFALLLPETEAEGAIALLRRLQVLLEREMARKGWPMTTSVGAITFLCPGGDVDRMVQRVDAMMYRAKREGKGRLEHAVTPNEQETQWEDRGGVERRATARVLCNRVARVRQEGEAVEEFATLRDLSVAGAGLRLERPLSLGTVLVVEPLGPTRRTLLARVVRVSAEGGGWLHGCVLSTRLNAEELRGWLAAERHGAEPAVDSPDEPAAPAEDAELSAPTCADREP